MLEKISIENYLSIAEKEELKVSNRITTLIGGNAVGKSSILKAISKLNGETIVEEEKNNNRKKNISAISAKFKLTKEERNQLIKKYSGSDAKHSFSYPDTNEDMYLTLSVSDDGNLSFHFNYEKEKNEEFDLLDYNFSKIIDSLTKEINKLKEMNPELKEKILSGFSSVELFLTILDGLSEEEKNQINPDIKSIISNSITEIKEKKYLSLIPKYKFIYLNSFRGLLVDKIELSEAQKNNTVKNFLNSANLKYDDIVAAIENESNKEIADIQNSVLRITTKDFKKIFSQADIDDEFQIQMTINAKSNELYFWIQNKMTNGKVIKFSEESEGMQWYLSMYILLHEYFEKDANDLTNYILLIDEPNIYLHASAQLDLLNNIFKEKLRDIQIIYTTHSPYMIDSDDLFSLRIIHKDNQTKIFNHTIDYLKAVNGDSKIKDVDVLSPVLMSTGLNITNSLVISKKDKIVVVEGPHDHYILSAMLNILNIKKDYKFVPCTGASKVPFMCGYLFGIGYSVIALVDSDKDGQNAKNELLFGNENYESIPVITYNKKYNNAYNECILEELFSEKDRETYMEKKSTPNYRYIYDNQNEIIFEDETKNNFKHIFDLIKQYSK